MADLKKIHELVSLFRHAIEVTDKEKLPIAFQRFPYGSCGDAALLLEKFLEQNGLGKFNYMRGSRAGRSHAWLQQGTLVVDITADQFPDNNEKVIVQENSEWHASFEIESDGKADLEKYDGNTSSMLCAAYRTIMENAS